MYRKTAVVNSNVAMETDTIYQTGESEKPEE